MAANLEDKPEIRPYRIQLQTADRREMDVHGLIAANLKLGEIEFNIESLLVSGLRNQMIMELRSREDNKNSLDFGCDHLWTEPTEGSKIALLYATPKLVPKQLRTVPPIQGGRRDSKSAWGPRLCREQS